MITRILESQIRQIPKSLLLLGPRQVGKSTILGKMKPDLTINLVREDQYTEHIKDPNLIIRLVEAQTEKSLILIDEIQRIPSMLNSVQALIDQNKNRKFLLTGSSARKLKRGKANLLPGRIFLRYLPPLCYWELQEEFNLQKALTKGLLPEIYLMNYGEELLQSYVSSYLKEEIQAEALTKDLGAYSRFLDLAASLSGQHLNFAKISSDTGISSQTIRRYFEILEDTLIIEKIPCYTEVPKARKPRQKEKFIFFDLGVRNNLLKLNQNNISSTEMGHLFEQFIILQCIAYKKNYNKNWDLMTYLDASDLEIDLIIKTSKEILVVEVKSSEKIHERSFKSLLKFKELTNLDAKYILVYRGKDNQKFNNILAMTYEDFLKKIIPSLG